VRQTPALYQLDNFVFQSARPNHTAFVMSVNSAPKSGPDGIFANGALYNIHVANDEKFKTGRSAFALPTTVTRYLSPIIPTARLAPLARK
jgi:hypothetical protein